MNKQEMIDKIYNVIATKRKEYCKLCPRCNSKVSREEFSDWSRTSHEAYECRKCWELNYSEWEQIDSKGDSIIEYNNPVMIGDLLDWIYKKWSWKGLFHHFNTIAPNRVEMRKPIDDQPMECIEYIYNLI